MSLREGRVRIISILRTTCIVVLIVLANNHAVAQNKNAAIFQQEQEANQSNATNSKGIELNAWTIYKAEIDKALNAKLPVATPMSFSTPGLTSKNYAKEKAEKKERQKLAKTIIKELEKKGKVIARPTKRSDVQINIKNSVRVQQNNRTTIIQQPNRTQQSTRPVNYAQKTNSTPGLTQTRINRIPTVKPSAIQGKLPINPYAQVPAFKKSNSGNINRLPQNQYIQPNQPLGQTAGISTTTLKKGYDRVPVLKSSAGVVRNPYEQVGQPLNQNQYGRVTFGDNKKNSLKRTLRASAYDAVGSPMGYGFIKPTAGNGSSSLARVNTPNQYTKAYESFGNGSLSRSRTSGYDRVNLLSKSATKAERSTSGYGFLPSTATSGSTTKPAVVPNQYTGPLEKFGTSRPRKSQSSNGYMQLTLIKDGSTNSFKSTTQRIKLSKKPNQGTYVSATKLLGHYQNPPKPGAKNYVPPPKPPGGKVVTTQRSIYDDAPAPKPRQIQASASNTSRTTSLTQQALQSRLSTRVTTQKNGPIIKQKLKPSTNLKTTKKASQTKKIKALKSTRP